MDTEKMSLLPNRLYLVLRPIENGQAFDATAYDTTDPKQPIPSAFFVLKGIMETLDTDLEGLVQKGQLAVMDKMVQLEEKGENVTSDMLSDNIEQVKIGKLH
tara:strand:+ start:307 stop:612 length:306 start_codon:yes stop_codon:yes gene_type:complete